MFSSPQVARVVAECEALIAQKDDAWSIDRASAVFLHQLVMIKRAKTILEIGMSYGHSGLFLADAVSRHGGKLFTVEANEKKVAAAQKYFTEAGLDRVVTILQGRAPEILSKAPEGIDLLFVDATKQEQQAYLDVIWPKLDAHAVIITDNVTTHAGEMAEYLKRLRTDPRLTSTLIPIGHGMELTVRL